MQTITSKTWPASRSDAATIAATILVLFFLAPLCRAADPDFAGQLPRIKPLEPDEAVKSFDIIKGFHVELIAAEPLVTDPIAIAFDEDGRAFVVEMRDYSEHPDDKLGRVRMLEDTDGDGKLDRSVIFAEQLSWPTAIACWDGGVFVGAAPDLLYLKDTDGDGKADVRRVVFTGFSRSNVQGLMNTFLWGLDNRIHGSASSTGGTIDKTSLRGRDFAFDPRTNKLEVTTGGAQHGATFDDYGRRFICSNSDHLQMVVIEDRYLQRNPRVPAPPARISIAEDGGQAEVFRISPVEPWRVLRTKLRVAGAVPGPIEGGGRAAGYFTSATGVTIYRGDAWPAEMRGQVFLGDVGSNIVHRKQLIPNGVTFTGKRIDQKREFLASRDIWFRPVQFANAPDGTLWICDMYREVIEHPASLPPAIKKHLDLDSGRDRGRLWRIAPDSFKPRAIPKLSKATTAELVRLLEHDNAWHRESAARLLYQRQDRAAVEPLRRLLLESQSPLGRLHAMYVLQGLAALAAEDVTVGLKDAHPAVRERAIGLSESLPETWAGQDQVWRDLTKDDIARVLYQLALSLGAWDGALAPAKQELAGGVLLAAPGDRWIRYAALNALGEDASLVLHRLVTFDMQSPQTLSGVTGLAQVLVGGDDKAQAAAVAALGKTSDSVVRAAAARGLVLGAGRRGEQVRRMAARHGGADAAVILDKLAQQAKTRASDEQQPLAWRMEAVDLLTLLDESSAAPVLAKLLQPRESQPIQMAALTVLAASANDSAAAEVIVTAWPGLSPAVRQEAMEVLLARPARAILLLKSIEKGDVKAGDIPAARAALLREHKDAAIRELATKLLKPGPAAGRADVIAHYQKEMLNLRGDAAAGKLLFAQQCAACHKLDGTGFEVGPNLAQFAQRGPEALLTNILDPNAEVNPQFVNYIITTTEGDTLTGLIASETAAGVALNRGGGAGDTIPRSRIESMRSSGLSLMPTNLDAALPPKQMADLLAYLLSPR